MKKALIALAVAAGSIAAAQADTTTLYGSIQFSSNVVDGNTLSDALKIDDHVWDLKNDHVRLGVKGTEDLGNGLEATFKIEGDNSSFSGRDAYLGLKGGFGEFRFGRQGSTWNVDDSYFETSDPAVNVEFGDDQKNELKARLRTAGLLTEGLEKQIDAVILPNSRQGHTVKYISPDFNGVTVAARIQADGENTASKGVDLWDAAVAYEANGLKASLAYGVAYDVVPAGVNGTNYEMLGAQVGYENDQFGIVGNVQNLSHEITSYNLQGKYMFDQSQLRVGFGYGDPRGDDNNFYNLGLGYQYNLSKRTSTWVEGVYTDVDRGDDNFSASVGIRHEF